MSQDSYQHKTAIVDNGAEIGKGTKIWHWVHVCESAKIGEDCVVGQNAFIGNNTVIGSGVKIQNNVSVYEGVILEDFVFCGPSMVFTNVINPRGHIERKTEFKKTHVGTGATIGANATVICGNNIGSYAMIAAGAVVSRNVPNYALMIGLPARQVGWVCACGEKLNLDMGVDSAVQCQACQKKYNVKGVTCSEV